MVVDFFIYRTGEEICPFQERIEKGGNKNEEKRKKVLSL